MTCAILFSFKQEWIDMASRQRNLQEDTDFRVMRILEENPDLTQRELAQKLGVSIGGLNYCLKALIEKGLVKMDNFTHSKNKFGYVYVLTPRGLAEKATITQRFLERKIQEYEALRVEIEMLRQACDPETHILIHESVPDYARSCCSFGRKQRYTSPL